MEASLNNALAAFEAFRRLGFPSDNLFFIQDEKSVFMALELPDKHFTIYCGPKNGTKDEVVEAWQKKAEAWNHTMTPDEREAIWTGSFISMNCSSLITGMLKKGFQLSGDAIRDSANFANAKTWH